MPPLPTGIEVQFFAAEVDSDFERGLQQARAVNDADMVAALLASLSIQTEGDLDMAEAVKSSLQQQPANDDSALAAAIQESLASHKREGKKPLHSQENQPPAARVSVGGAAGSSGSSGSGRTQLTLLQVSWPVLAETFVRLQGAMVNGDRSADLMSQWWALNAVVLAARAMQPASPQLIWAMGIIQDAMDRLFAEHGTP